MSSCLPLLLTASVHSLLCCLPCCVLCHRLVSLLVSLAPSLPPRCAAVLSRGGARAATRARCWALAALYPRGKAALSWPAYLPRYDDPEVKKFKLNAERNNGRAAMMGITGMITHNALGVDSLFPIVS